MEFSIFRGAPEYSTFGSVLYGFELKNGTRTGEESWSDNPAQLGIVTGIFTTACIFNLKIIMLKEDFLKEPLHMEPLRLKAMFYFVLNLLCFCIFSPLVFSSLVILYAYRCAVTVALKIQLGKKFVGLLEGTDSVWAVEDACCKSVINVLATLEVASQKSNADLLLKLRELAEQKFFGPDAKFDKLSCLRKKRYGYFYWERRDSVDITEHVRWLEAIDDEDPDEEKKPKEEFFNEILSKLCTKPLPQNDQASWEILVSRSHLRDDFDRFKDMEEGLIFPAQTNTSRKNFRIPIIFRVHHTVGDGFALFRLLLATITDSKAVEIKFENKREEIPPAAVIPRDKNKRNDLTKLKLYRSNTDNEFIFRNNKNLLGASMPFSLIINEDLKKIVEKYVRTKLGKFASFHEFGEAVFEFSIKNIKETIERLAKITLLKLTQIAKMMSVLIGMPSCLVYQALRSMDNSALHGQNLSGEKIVSFWIEGDSMRNIGDRNLVKIIQRVKNATGTRFGDVVLAALSASLHKYFKQIGEFSPKSLTVVLPSRMSIPDENLRLDNGFSVGLLPLCISGSPEVQGTYMAESRKDLTIMERLFDVARNSHNLRGRSDYLVNFWVMKWLSAVLPEVLLRPILKSHSTLVFSNVPGPQEVQIHGQRLRNIVFWVPHRGTTGISFSVLSYGGKMHLGLLVDKALIKNDNLLAEILENTVQEINNLHETIFMSHFSKSLHNLKTASTNIESESCENRRYI